MRLPALMDVAKTGGQGPRRARLLLWFSSKWKPCRHTFRRLHPIFGEGSGGRNGWNHCHLGGITPCRLAAVELAAVYGWGPSSQAPESKSHCDFVLTPLSFLSRVVLYGMTSGSRAAFQKHGHGRVPSRAL